MKILIITLIAICLVGCKDEVEEAEFSVLQEGDPIEQTHRWGWGKVPTVRFPEPNEPECKHENIGKTVLLQTCGVYHSDGSICWVCPDCGEYVSSNEQKLYVEDFAIPPIDDMGEPFILDANMILSLIPTWPDYIELEKDLILRYDYPEPNTPPHEISILPSYAEWSFSKGTKIYFKD